MIGPSELVRKVALLVAAAFIIVTAAGCAQNLDASDPDPHYYKGKHFTHKRTG